MATKLPPFETNLERFTSFELRRTAQLFPSEPFTIHLKVSEPPSDLRTDMKDMAPQALLRDLHRPVEKFHIGNYDMHPIPWDRGARGTMAWLKDHFVADYRIPIESLLHTPADLAETIAERKQLIGMDWNQVPKLGLKAVTSSEPQFFQPGFDVPDWFK